MEALKVLEVDCNQYPVTYLLDILQPLKAESGFLYNPKDDKKIFYCMC